MTTAVRSRKGRSRARVHLAKASGVISPRVQAVGPERFGIVSVDCAKARSKWMLCDFFGKVLLPPTEVEHNRIALDRMVAQLRRAIDTHALQDVLVAIERTGRYHRPIQAAYRAAG